jgi:hypothetical protein
MTKLAAQEVLMMESIERRGRIIVQARTAVGAMVLAAAALASGCGIEKEIDEGAGTEASEIIQTCTAQNVIGFPYAGTVCGGSVIDDCSKGVLYTCRKGARDTRNNCTFSQSCAIGCLTGPTSTPVSANTSSPRASDACFNGAPPLTLSTTDTVGGEYVTMTATLAQAHAPFAIVNLTGTTPEVPPLCDVPVIMAANATTVSWVEPTGPVATTKQVPLSVLTSFNDTSGRSRNLVAVPTTLTLRPGGAVTVPPLATFEITDADGNPVSTVRGGTNAFARGTLSIPAPVGGVNVDVAASPASAFVTSGDFTINVGCTSNGTSGVLTATTAVTSDLAVTVTATTGAGATLSRNVSITPPALVIQSMGLSPSTVKGGSSLTATITLNRNVTASDASSLTSVRISEGLVSGAKIASFAGCTGTPVCIGPITVPVGSRTASFTISTQLVSTQDIVTVAVDADWSNQTASAQLTIDP